MLRQRIQNFEQARSALIAWMRSQGKTPDANLMHPYVRDQLGHSNELHKSFGIRIEGDGIYYVYQDGTVEKQPRG